MRRYLCLLLVLCILCLVLPVFGSTYEPDTLYMGVDVSVYQGNIDWEAATPYIDFAILRCAYGRNYAYQDDSCFLDNADACTRLGIPFGVYLYSYAMDEQSAKSEAEHVLRMLENYSPSLPVYLDLEDLATTAKLSNEQILKQTKIFCDIISEAGYTPGVYASYSWWKTRLTDPAYDEYSRWVAYWGVESFELDRTVDAWQYSNRGSVPGIGERIDLNYWYGELPLVEPRPVETVEPTCTELGYTRYTLPTGEEKICRYVGALWHSYEAGVCVRCGEAEKPLCGEACPGSIFTDMPDGWQHAGIDYCVGKRLMNGTGADTFSPDGTVTRAQLVTILYRLAGSPKTDFTGRFSDVAPGKWYSDAVEWAATEGIVNGMGDGVFCPDGEITREQISSIFFRATENVQLLGDIHRFSDYLEVSNFAVNPVVWAASEGLLNGISREGKVYLASKEPATRAQIAAIMMRYLQKFGSLYEKENSEPQNNDSE